MSTYPSVKSQPKFYENHGLRCLICEQTSSLGEFQEIESDLSLDSNEEKGTIIKHLEDSTNDLAVEFSINFMHKSTISNLSTVNICQSCYEAAKQKLIIK